MSDDKPMFVQITVKVEVSDNPKFYYSRETAEYDCDFVLPLEVAREAVDLNAIRDKAIDIAVERYINPPEKD